MYKAKNGGDETLNEKQTELILAIESSCDETSVAVVKDGQEILSNIVASQINSHKRFGGSSLKLLVGIT